MNVAFLQNQWVRDPDRVRAMIEKQGERYRQLFVRYALFAGCMTGRRIKSAFGDAIDDIRWDNASPQIAGQSSGVFPADHDHMRRVIAEEKPDVVLAFGQVAAVALTLLRREDGSDWKIITGPHPAARHATVTEELRGMAELYRAYE